MNSTILELILTPTEYLYYTQWRKGRKQKDIAFENDVTPSTVCRVLKRCNEKIRKEIKGSEQK